MEPIRRKLVVVGQDTSGKTCLLTVFALGRFPETYVPSVFGGYVADIEVGGKALEVALWDTVGNSEYERLRPLSYPDTHVVLLCFAIDSLEAFEEVQQKWAPEIRHYCPGVPIVLVGCKKDLRHDPHTVEGLRITHHRSPVTRDEGVAVAQTIGAKSYFECSAKTGEGVRELFQYASLVSLDTHRKRSRGRCVVF